MKLLPYVAALAMLAALVSIPVVLPACNGAVFPVLQQIEQKVLADIEAGDSVAQIEVDVGFIVGQDVGDAGQVGADIVRDVQDAVQVLVDFHLIPAQFLSAANTVHDTEHAKLVARGEK
jgi:hypothetical protein